MKFQGNFFRASHSKSCKFSSDETPSLAWKILVQGKLDSPYTIYSGFQNLVLQPQTQSGFRKEVLFLVSVARWVSFAFFMFVRFLSSSSSSSRGGGSGLNKKVDNVCVILLGENFCRFLRARQSFSEESWNGSGRKMCFSVDWCPFISGFGICCFDVDGRIISERALVENVSLKKFLEIMEDE